MLQEAKRVTFRVKDLQLATQGDNSIYLAERRMPTLARIRRRLAEEQPLTDITIGACLHVTRETAVLAQTLQAAGATIALAGSNPLSTQDDVAAALAREGMNVYAWRGNDEEYYDCIRSVLNHQPDILIDDGADLIVTAHRENKELLSRIAGAQEETTTGVLRLKAMEKQGALEIPVIAVNNAQVKTMFDNVYGTGQGVVAAIGALNVLFAGKTVVVAGYGYCSRGMATRSRGLGSNVIVTEVDPIRALEAVMDGYQVMPMDKAVERADMIFTSTGCTHVVKKGHFEKMKDGAILANFGHFNVEIAVSDLEAIAIQKRRINEFVDEYSLSNKKKLYLLGEGRLANLIVLGGHPSEIMDLSFSVQALTSEYIIQHKASLTHKVYEVFDQIDKDVARAKLETMGVTIDSWSAEQQSYVEDFELGT
ncbi:MAG: adenosylhomocysteinase [Candidatus Bathyarchaeota archaeon]|nr:MAG: adenosylhomocysteinase [Candidatus Bathyarchaeota archaeon]